MEDISNIVEEGDCVLIRTVAGHQSGIQTYFCLYTFSCFDNEILRTF